MSDDKFHDDGAATSSSGDDGKKKTTSTELRESLPNNVKFKEQLACLPGEYLSDDPQRPLLYTDAKDGISYTYALRPLTYSVMFILFVEGLERFSYYGINFSQTAYLTGVYDKDWNATMTSVEASSVTAAMWQWRTRHPCWAVFGRWLAGRLLADHDWPGVAVRTGRNFGGLDGLSRLAGQCGTFNHATLVAGMLALRPLGAGVIKSIVNIFGAKLYHPVLHAGMIEQYYVSYYMAINIGALAGGVIVPIVATHKVGVAYAIPAVALVLGLFIFLAGWPRCVKRKPSKDSLWNTLELIGSRAQFKSFDAAKQSNGGIYDDLFVDGVARLLLVVPITILVVPFNVAYSQMSTAFIVQGTVMQNAPPGRFRHEQL